MPYPAICVGCRFFDEHSEEKNCCAARESGAVLQALPSGVQGQNPGNFWLFCILNSSKHCSLGSATRNVDESLHQKSALFSIWEFEFGITNRYTSFKIALDTALCMYVCMYLCIHLCIYISMHEFPDDNKQEILEPKHFNIFCYCIFK